MEELDLTAREEEVLALMAEGRSNLSLAEMLGTTVKTVETHVRTIFAKLGLKPTPRYHRRVVAVITYLGSRPRPAGDHPRERL